MARYKGRCSASSAQTLSKMDFNKIDYDLIEAVLVHIVECAPNSRGSVLVFLPGMQEITTLHDQLLAHPVFGKKANKFQLIPLHSSLSSEEQALVFAKIPQVSLFKFKLVQS